MLTFLLSFLAYSSSPYETFSYACEAFQSKCTTCHSAEYSYQSCDVLPSYWNETTERMQAMEDSGITQKEAQAIAEYLIYDSSERRKPLLEKRLKSLAPEEASKEEAIINNIRQKYGG